MLITLTLFLAQSHAQPTYDHVILISVDGLRSDALLTNQAKSFRNFQRLLTGSYTLNGRTDCDFTVTLPNHIGMLTSRLTNEDGGHHYTENGTPSEETRLIDADGKTIDSIFTVTAANEVHSSLIASKKKFILFKQSYGEMIDDYFIDSNGDKQMTHLLNDLKSHSRQRSFNFIHFLPTDVAGHTYGWNLSPDSKYMQSVAAVDALLGDLFDYLDANPEYSERTAIVLTADHGGGAPHHNHHGIGHLSINYVIPFITWTGDGQVKADLIALNSATHRDPGIDDPRPQIGRLPVIRNADVGNLCLSLLGMPSIANSTRNTQQSIVIK